MTRIDISWKGPLSAQKVEKLRKRKDYGIYAAYGRNPVYGPGTVLLYIGKANEQTFGKRIKQHIWRRGGSWFGGTSIQFYIGRLCGNSQPGNDEWRELIDEAEKLLIHAHAPSWNSQHINELRPSEEYTNVHVFNWGYYGDLLPEVSCERLYADPPGIDHIWEYAPG